MGAAFRLLKYQALRITAINIAVSALLGLALLMFSLAGTAEVQNLSSMVGVILSIWCTGTAASLVTLGFCLSWYVYFFRGRHESPLFLNHGLGLPIRLVVSWLSSGIIAGFLALLLGIAPL